MGRSKSNRRRRETLTFSNRRLPPLSSRSLRSSETDPGEARRSRYVTEDNLETPRRRRPNLRQVEDRRQWHPEGPRRAPGARNRFAPRLVTPGWVPLGGDLPTAKIGFADPLNVAVCVRRKQRREVLFAKHKAGRRGQRRPKRNWFSNIKCRR